MHDWKRFPELADHELDIYYFQSPHKQIFEDFHAKVVKVHDGDTVTLRWSERDFDFPLRFINIAAPEMREPDKKTPIQAGQESQQWLENKLLDQEVLIKINPYQRS